jgi:LPS sulfotransferase NodH
MSIVMEPKVSYTIWFSQRNGSSLLCEGLKSTGIAGRPEELFNIPAPTTLLEHYQAEDYSELQETLWAAGSTSNGVWGVKTNAPRKNNDPIIDQLSYIPGLEKAAPTHFEVWENAFPNHRHIFLTRRNKIEQAVSWWKAIVSSEWHRKMGSDQPYSPENIRDKYDFKAIRHLLLECSLREAKIQDLLNQAKAIPLTIVYEDFAQDFESTIRKVVRFLGVDQDDYPIGPPHYERLADDLSEEWTERFRVELQKDWEHIIW